MTGWDDPVLGPVQQPDRGADGSGIATPGQGVRDIIVDLAVRPGVESGPCDLSQPAPRPLDLRDTGLSVPAGSVTRLPASYRHTDSGLVQLEPAAGGFYAGHPPFDVSHVELVSTVADYTRFARMLADGGRFEGRQIVSEEHLRLMTGDQVPAAAKTSDSFIPGFWDRTGWGFGVGVDTESGRPAATGGPADWAPTSSSKPPHLTAART
ncbi:hypothetical protein [Actinoplanes sp. NPDC089786]|uniref:hypothetical protein n=1 Tax=Actinoplanes sp. NPDC089786 TaxID=3155185 RepID=UPI003447D484